MGIVCVSFKRQKLTKSLPSIELAYTHTSIAKYRRHGQQTLMRTIFLTANLFYSA